MTISTFYSGNTAEIHKYLKRNRKQRGKSRKQKICAIELRQKHDEGKTAIALTSWKEVAE